jgi:DNA-binding NarL/FixJ family response regulator
MTLTTKTKILLVDDHQLFNDGVKSLWSSEPNIEIVGQVFEAKSVLYEIQKLSPQLLFLDINLPDGNGIEFAKIIVKDLPQIKIILLTMYDDFTLLKEAKKIGVHVYILKNTSQKQLLQAVQEVMEGNTFFDESISKVLEPTNREEISKKYSLTEREIEIVGFVRDGLDSYQIADNMNLSYHTIKTHRRNIHFKIGTNTTPEMIRFANENGF